MHKFCHRCIGIASTMLDDGNGFDFTHLSIISDTACKESSSRHELQMYSMLLALDSHCPTKQKLQQISYTNICSLVSMLPKG